MEKQWKMRTADFYALLKAQGYRCSLSQEELTPETTCIARILPIEQGGKHELTNTYLVHRNVHPLTRNCSREEIHIICRKILGKLSKSKKISHKFSKSNWTLFHDRIITFNNTRKSTKSRAHSDETWAESALRCSTELNLSLRKRLK